MSCSRALRCSRSVCSLGIGTASRSSSSLHGREDRRGVRELRKHDEPHRQERRAAGDGRVDHRQHAVGVGAHLRAVERIGWSVWQAAAAYLMMGIFDRAP